MTNTTDSLTLNVDPTPTVSAGDTLRIVPDLGHPYRATVLAVIDDEKIRVRIPGDAHGHPHPSPPQKRVFHRDELEEWYVMGDLSINPPTEMH
jgi:hypothetical protein